ncbi:hypothetical protein DFH09DRAFT_1193132 [Mycena vulgaris]|nr:hypothetical protein DFH09DRAFT_1193132 [Mycena vulgaris]
MSVLTNSVLVAWMGESSAASISLCSLFESSHDFAAGRIWWARQEIRVYNTAIAIILESGSIYCSTVIAGVVSASFCPPWSPVSQIFRGAIPLVVVRGPSFPYSIPLIITVDSENIAPTLIIVRVGLRRQVDSETRKETDSLRVKRPIHAQ